MAYGAMPAARSLRASCNLKVCKSVIPRCSPLPVTHTLSALAAAGVYAVSYAGPKDEVGWLGGAAIMGALIPYHVALISPIKKRVLAGEVAEEDVPAVMETWSNYHLCRTLVASGVFLYFAYKLAAK